MLLPDRYASPFASFQGTSSRAVRSLFYSLYTKRQKDPTPPKSVRCPSVDPRAIQGGPAVAQHMEALPMVCCPFPSLCFPFPCRRSSSTAHTELTQPSIIMCAYSDTHCPRNHLFFQVLFIRPIIRPSIGRCTSRLWLMERALLCSRATQTLTRTVLSPSC